MMRKILILIVLIGVFSTVYSQDETIKTIQRLTLENDSLKKEVIQPLRDSIVSCNGDLKNLQFRISALVKDSVNLHNQIKKPDKKNNTDILIQNMKTGLQQKSDSIVLLDSIIKRKDRQIATTKQDEYNNGQQSVYSKIESSYQGNFDNLIKSSTRLTIERDLPLVGNDTKQKLQNLQKYFDAQQVLSEQYNKQKANDAQKLINGIEQTELVVSLSKNLKDYKMYSDSLKSTIGRIFEIDQTYKANKYEKGDRTKKRSFILSELSRYFRNYHRYVNYPYLSNIIMDIMDKKQEDPNTDISDLLNKL